MAIHLRGHPRSAALVAALFVGAAMPEATPGAGPPAPDPLEIAVRFEGLQDICVVGEEVGCRLTITVRNRSDRPVSFPNLDGLRFRPEFRVGLPGTDGKRALHCRPFGDGEGCHRLRGQAQTITLKPGAMHAESFYLHQFGYGRAEEAGEYKLIVTVTLPGQAAHTAEAPFRVAPLDIGATVSEALLQPVGEDQDSRVRLYVLRLNGSHFLYGRQFEVKPDGTEGKVYAVGRLGELGKQTAYAVVPDPKGTRLAHLLADGTARYVLLHPGMFIPRRFTTSADLRKADGPTGAEVREWIKSTSLELMDATGDAALRRAIDADRRYLFGKGG